MDQIALAKLNDLNQDAVAQLRNFVNAMPRNHPDVANLKDALACLDLASTFYAEANKAIEAEVWFAAAGVAAGALEALLLGKLFLNSDKVTKLPSFAKSLAKQNGDLGAFARTMDLGKLLDIAKELAWFQAGDVPSSLTDMLSHYAEADTLTALAAIFKDSPSAGYASADLLRKYRNLLHPACCLKETIVPTKNTGIAATYCCLVAFASLGST